MYRESEYLAEIMQRNFQPFYVPELDDEIIVEEVDEVNDILEQWQYGSLVPVTAASEPIFRDDAWLSNLREFQNTDEGDPDLYFLSFFLWNNWETARLNLVTQ
jgi:hypothetical protein